MRPLLLTVLLMLLSYSPAGQAGPVIVATIKPLHSLVAALVAGVGADGAAVEVELLIAASQSPHHYSLRPSERRMLARADRVFWIGPQLESFMPRLLHSIQHRERALALIDADDLILHRLRGPHADHADAHTAHDANGQVSGVDPHIWLDTRNIVIMAERIVGELAALDPEHAAHYRANLDRLKQDVAALRESLQQQLADADAPFLVYHDAYQYFEREFSLNNAGFVSFDSEVQPGAAHIRELKQDIQQHNIGCIFYEAPLQPPLIKTLTAGNQARAVQLDATGKLLEPGKQLLPQLLRALAQQFSSCLMPGI